MAGPGPNIPPVVIARFKCATTGGNPVQPVVDLAGLDAMLQYDAGMTESYISVVAATPEAMARLQAECLPWDGGL